MFERLWSTGRIALYPLPGAKASHVVHSFYYHPEMDQCHGKVITRARFRRRRNEDLPDPELLKYHDTIGAVARSKEAKTKKGIVCTVADEAVRRRCPLKLRGRS